MKEPESKALTAERALRSEWRVYQPDGSFVAADTFDYQEHQGLKDLVAYEWAGTRLVEEAPPHIKLMREHELVDYEPASDAGNLRWYPNGLLVKRLLEQHATRMVADYGAMEVETPIMYDYGHPALASYLQRFPARQYVVTSDQKEFFLRFAACFGQYMIQRDMVTSYRHLPVRLYELTHFSFRREQSGELAGLRRLRTFTMPDMHTLVGDMAMAKQEFLRQVSLCLRWLDDVGLECVPAIRFVRCFLDENPGFVEQIMGALNRPALVEVWDERIFYYVAKFEMNFVDAARKAACLSTVQIDVENAERFGIRYVAEDGAKRHPLLMHASVSGSIDRNVYAILENQAIRMARGEKAVLPVWLAPTQVRILPVSSAHVPAAIEICDRLSGQSLRADVDDRDETVGRKIRDGQKEWVPFLVVLGEREVQSGQLSVRIRADDRQQELSLGDLVRLVRGQVGDMPQRPVPLPKLLSQRPVFGR
jgi:threonyl-tRNA synthetase